jgi:hypothetical protein
MKKFELKNFIIPGIFILTVFNFFCQINGQDWDVAKIKRAEIFEFTEKPHFKKEGDKFTLSFTSKAFCDVTIAIENTEGKIVRHLASGVLGANAPEPFKKNSLSQEIIWDSKDDLGHYVELEKNDFLIRVSLGLKPQFEKNLLWSPYRRIGPNAPIAFATEEGVFVYDSKAIDHLRLFDHDGNYLRTIHPMPATKIKDVKGLEWQTSARYDDSYPKQEGFVQGTFLKGGDGAFVPNEVRHGDDIFSATALAIKKDRIALAFFSLSRLSTDGSSGGLLINGPKTGFIRNSDASTHFGFPTITIGPSSMAFNANTKKLYMTGYMWSGRLDNNGGSCPVVRVMDYESENEPTTFVGNMKEEDYGSDDKHLNTPTSVVIDNADRIYVSDYMNDRIQVFNENAELLKSIKVQKPAKIFIHHKTQDIYVFTCPLRAIEMNNLAKSKQDELIKKIKPAIANIGTFEKFKAPVWEELPLGAPSGFLRGNFYQVEFDDFATVPSIWVAEQKFIASARIVQHHGSTMGSNDAKTNWAEGSQRLLIKANNKWVVKRDFAEEAKKVVERLMPGRFGVQRLYVNSKTGKLYVLEFRGYGGWKSHDTLLEIDPQTNKVKELPIPFSAEDMCFDRDGNLYLRTESMVGRFNINTMKEIPWDYGREQDKVTMSGKSASLISGLVLPGLQPMCGQQGGMVVNAKGELAVSCVSVKNEFKPTFGELYTAPKGVKQYKPPIYEGRLRWQEIQVFNKQGQSIIEDAIPGLAIINGFNFDENNNFYVMAADRRLVNGKDIFGKWSGTLIKFKSKKGLITSSVQTISENRGVTIPLPKEKWPKREPDLVSKTYDKAWVEGADWFFGGVGFTGWNADFGGVNANGIDTFINQPCGCWHSRPAFDFYNRVFLPEQNTYGISVVDPNGNLIMHFGKYGNVDDGMPLIKEGGPASPRSIGDSEVAFMRVAYLAVESDKNLYATDPGNARILSIKLGYHTEEKVKIENRSK